MISIKQLHYALAVEELRHFKKAAERCSISQPALSNALLEFEKQLGIQVFERNNRKVLITPQGEEVLQHARSILSQVDTLQRLSENQKQPLCFPITVGVVPTIAPFLLSRVFPVLKEHHPKSHLNIVEEQSHILVDMVRKGEIDTAVLALPYPIDGLLNIEFWQEDLYWVAKKGSKYSDQQENGSREVNQTALIMLKDGHCLKDHVLDVCKYTAQIANLGFGAANLSTIIQMVLGGLGTTLVPRMALEQLVAPHDELNAIPLNDPGPHRRVAFIFRPNYTRVSSISNSRCSPEPLYTKGFGNNFS